MPLFRDLSLVLQEPPSLSGMAVMYVDCGQTGAGPPQRQQHPHLHCRGHAHQLALQQLLRVDSCRANHLALHLLDLPLVAARLSVALDVQ